MALRHFVNERRQASEPLRFGVFSLSNLTDRVKFEWNRRAFKNASVDINNKNLGRKHE
jgi:hypothetical protein